MIRIDNLTKDYGSFRALNSINFKIEDGEILGFLGPNGAGKTTTMQIMTSYLAPTDGNVIVDDLNIIENPQEIKKQIGYLPEHNPLYEDMTAYDFLEFVSQLRNIDSNSIKKRIEEVVELCGLSDVVHRKIGVLSKGYQQRVGLGQSIIHDPNILILDEPTSGLDPNQIAEIRELIKRLGQKKTVMISSHILQEIKATAERMVIIDEGEISADGTMDELMDKFQGATILDLEIAEADSNDIKSIESLHDDVNITDLDNEGENIKVSLEYPQEVDLRSEVFQYAGDKGWQILEMSRSETSLEDVFRQLTVEKGGTNDNE